VKGGRADENFHNCNTAHVRQLRWRADVLDPDNCTLRVCLYNSVTDAIQHSWLARSADIC
jgi:hypothetical protein